MVKYFCDVCGREIFTMLTDETKRNTSIAEMELITICSVCVVYDSKEKEKK